MTRRKKVLFMVPYPLGEAPSQRFRFEQYFSVLPANSIEFDVQTFLTRASWRVFYKPGKITKKAAALGIGFCRRIVGTIGVWKYDFVFIHREVAPIGPPIFEWVIANIFRKKIIYDFDDAIWLTDNRSESLLTRTLKNRRKVSTICRMAYRVSCGNAYLASFARQYNNSVTFNPTTLDTDRLRNINLDQSRGSDQLLTIGWTGSHSTLKYLEAIEPILQRIERGYPDVNFVFIADRPPRLNLSRMTFVRWNAETEVNDLMKIGIGLMPLPDDEWSKGKCGFKILQYMSLGIPSVSSAVGVNREIVKQDVNGFLCYTDDDWFRHIQSLIDNPLLRQRFGTAGRDTVLQHYSVNSNTATFLSLFE